MSDKTTVPGMEGPFQNFNFGNNNPNARDPFGMQPMSGGMYGATVESGGTVVGAYAPVMPNMQPAAAPIPQPMPDPYMRPQRNDQPIYGFLYSVSRVPTGEFWPLYQGNNTIGRDASCDVCLSEATVSRQHLSLVIRKNRNPEKIIAAVRDLGSTEGTLLNGQSLEFEVVECRNGDIITVGQSYELVFILVDTIALGLKQAENFIPTGMPAQPQMPNMQQMPGVQMPIQPQMPGMQQMQVQQPIPNMQPMSAPQMPAAQMPSLQPLSGMPFMPGGAMPGASQMTPSFDPSMPPSFRPDNVPPTTAPRYTPSDGTVGLDGGLTNNSSRGGTELML